MILLAVLSVIYFSDILFSDKVFSFRDLSRYYYPLRQFAFSRLKAGSFPFWNPYVGSGHPLFAAVQSAVLYPLSLIYFLPNHNLAFNLFIAAHIFLAGVFFYLLMTDLKFGRISGIISAIVFMFGGYLIAVINLTTTLSAAIWFPLCFLFYLRALNQRRFIYAVLSAVTLGFMFLGGEPTPMYATVILLAVYSGVYCFAGRRDFLKTAAMFIGIILLFLFLFGFQILPFIELLKLSNRSQSSFTDSSYWSFPPRDIVNFIMPFFYGPLHYLKDGHLRQDWLLLTYLGIIPLMLFFIAVFFRKDNYSNFFKGVFIAGIILIFGRWTPLYKLLYEFIPGFGLIRYPVKFFFLSAVAFAFLSGAGWQAYAEKTREQDGRFLKFIKGIFVLGFIAAVVFLLLYLFRQWFYDLAAGYLKGIDDKNPFYNLRYITIFDVDFFNFRRLLVFFILGALFLFAGAKKKLNISLTGVLLSALIFIDLYGVKNIDANPAISVKTMNKNTPQLDFLRKDKGLFRIYTSFQMNKLNETLRGNTYEEAFANSIDNLCANRLIEYGIYDARGYFSVHNNNYSKLLNVPDTSPSPSSTNILNMLNVKYILTAKEIQDSRCRLVNKTAESFLYENMDVMPRAYIVPEYIVLQEELDIYNKLRVKEFNPAKEVIISGVGADSVSLRGAERQDMSAGPAGEYLNILRYEPNEVIIEANISDKPKFVVLADNYYPGWQVFIDGKKDRIYKANFVLRGVYAPQGRHTIRFVYDSFVFKLGALISLITLGIVIIFIFYENDRCHARV